MAAPETSTVVVAATTLYTNNTFPNAFDSVISFFILLLIGVLAFSIRLFSVIKYESVIHEFDPYFNYRVTQVGMLDEEKILPVGKEISV